MPSDSRGHPGAPGPASSQRATPPFSREISSRRNHRNCPATRPAGCPVVASLKWRSGAAAWRARALDLAVDLSLAGARARWVVVALAGASTTTLVAGVVVVMAGAG